ncbi:MAG TPA: hypothetical protein VHN81_04005 [Edaphobacter sp.]|nr:hypothetical protein [Edaphobacter sp.]
MLCWFAVSDLKFNQPARRNLLVPVLIAFLILGMAIAIVLRYTPATTAKLKVVHTAVYPTHTEFKADSIIVGRDRSQDDLYVVTTLNMEDRLNLPLFIKDMTATLETADGEKIETSAVQKQDFENLFTTFPALKPLVTAAPLLRDTLIESGKSVEGTVVFHFPVTEDVWNHRRAATLHIALYHQGRVSVTIPTGDQASSSKDEGNAEDE